MRGQGIGDAARHRRQRRLVEDDLAAAIVKHAASWAVELAAEVERAREAARATLHVLADAIRRIGDAASARGWLDTAVDEARFDRPARPMITATIAPSSRRRTANSEPLTAAELLGYISELLTDPPTSAPSPEIATAPLT